MEPPHKRAKPEDPEVSEAAEVPLQPERVKGLAPIKKEFLVDRPAPEPRDDAAEGNLQRDDAPQNNNKKKRGQNKQRKLAQVKETVKYCERPREANGRCGLEKCSWEHDVGVYLAAKLEDIDGMCPVYEAIGYCPVGIKCRWLGSHFEAGALTASTEGEVEEVNRVAGDELALLARRKFVFKLADEAIKTIDNEQQNKDEKRDNYAGYFEGTLKPTEKNKLDYNRKYVLSPLTTVGNLPYRRLMKTLGVDITFSEMALALPIVQGGRSEWALPRAHKSELGGFGIQLAGSKPWHLIKAVEAIKTLAPLQSEFNLNCGCPIDLLYRQGSGSALMENPARLLRILKGMSLVSGETPVTVKIRTGTRDGHNTAMSLVKRVVAEQNTHAITLHGRSRQQRYTREANWDYISEVATCIKEERQDKEIQPWIIGNGDVYCWEDWYNHIEQQNVDTCMVARGALIKPWIFEEIEAKQYLDKSATERLEYIKQYAHYGLSHWGSDQYGVELTRRFLCEWLSFTYRYIPEGILEYLPPKMNDRPRAFEGRNELETLLASGNYKDWIKISEMFLGKTPGSFEFEPKHKSNAYDKEAPGKAGEAPIAAAPSQPAAETSVVEEANF